MKLFLKKQCLLLLKKTVQNNLNQKAFNQDNFKVLQASIFANVFLSLATSIIYQKISLTHFNYTLCFFSILCLMTISSFIFSILYIKIINKGYFLTKNEGQNSLSLIENQIKDLEKEKIKKERKYLENKIQMNNNNNSSKPKAIKKI